MVITKKNKPWWEAWNFQPHLQFSLEGRRAESAINDSSCPFDEASWNPNSRGFREHLGWWACGGTGRGQGPSDPLSHTPFPMCLFHPNAHLYPLYPFYNEPVHVSKGFPDGSVAKNLPAKQETQIRSLSGEDPLEEGMTTYSNTLAWEVHGQRSLASHSL